MLTLVNSSLTNQINKAKDLIDAFYRQMYTIRKVEQTLLDLFAQGYLTGTVHTSIGQEACDVGVINSLDRSKDILLLRIAANLPVDLRMEIDARIQKAVEKAMMASHPGLEQLRRA